MSIRFTFDPIINIIFTRAEGVLSARAFTEHLATKAAEALVDIRELFDAADAVISVTEADARECARTAQSLSAGHGSAPTAIVVRDEHFDRMISFVAALHRLGSAPNTAVFRTYDSALDWLVRHNTFSRGRNRGGTRDT